jgi:hypothetical protein
LMGSAAHGPGIVAEQVQAEALRARMSRPHQHNESTALPVPGEVAG